MNARIDIQRIAPRALQAMMGLQNHVNGSGLEHNLLTLVKMRASQINGCAYCLDMHSKDARTQGESEQRLYLLHAWRETQLYSPRERAALEWTEGLTRIADEHVPDHIYAAVREHFSEDELLSLSLAVVAINGWNRLMIGFRVEGGSYKPGAHAAAQRAGPIAPMYE